MFIITKNYGIFKPKRVKNTVKKAQGAKVQILFRGLYITHVIFVLVYNLKFIF